MSQPVNHGQTGTWADSPSVPPRHTVTFAWEKDDEQPSATIECPWEPTDPDRPCRMFDDWEAENPTKPIDGCGLIDHFHNGGYEAIGLIADIVAPPVLIEMRWNEYPEIGPCDV